MGILFILNENDRINMVGVAVIEVALVGVFVIGVLIITRGVVATAGVAVVEGLMFGLVWLEYFWTGLLW